jgi:hypothetical protein
MRFIARLPRYEAVLIYGTVTRKVTDQRTARDFAACMRDRADIHYPDADHIRVVLDNLSTHTAGRCMKPSPPPKRTAFFSAWSSITHPSTPVG